MPEDLSHLIEIGDPEDDAVVPGPAEGPQVVIEYRDRGLPWMLVLPLLVTAAAVAIVGFKAFDARVRPDAPERLDVAALGSPAEPPPAPSPRIVPDDVARDSAGMPLPPPSPVALPLASIAPATDASTEPPAAPRDVSEVVASVPANDPPGISPTPDPTLPAAEPRPFPKVAGLGFDPEALNRALERSGAAEEVRPAGHPDVAPDGPDLPRAVDPGDLPRDPVLARRERMRRVAEGRRQLEAERARFHAELQALSRRFGAKSAPAVADLCRRYGTEPDPAAKVQAARMLNVAAAGADPVVRINLLRSLGFPEAAILLDIVENMGRWEDGRSRNGPRTKDEVLHRAVLFLLRCPPKKGAGPASPTASAPPRRAPDPIR